MKKILFRLLAALAFLATVAPVAWAQDGYQFGVVNFKAIEVYLQGGPIACYYCLPGGDPPIVYKTNPIFKDGFYDFKKYERCDGYEGRFWCNAVNSSLGWGGYCGYPKPGSTVDLATCTKTPQKKR